MRLKTGNYSTFGQGLLLRLQTVLRSWSYSGYCFMQMLKIHRETLSIFWLEHRLPYLSKLPIISFVKRKTLSMRKNKCQ